METRFAFGCLKVYRMSKICLSVVRRLDHCKLIIWRRKQIQIASHVVACFLPVNKNIAGEFKTFVCMCTQKLVFVKSLSSWEFSYTCDWYFHSVDEWHKLMIVYLNYCIWQSFIWIIPLKMKALCARVCAVLHAGYIYNTHADAEE